MANINQGIPSSEIMKPIFVGRKNNIPKFSFSLFVIIILFTFATDFHVSIRILAQEFGIFFVEVFIPIQKHLLYFNHKLPSVTSVT